MTGEKILQTQMLSVQILHWRACIVICLYINGSLFSIITVHIDQHVNSSEINIIISCLWVFFVISKWHRVCECYDPCHLPSWTLDWRIFITIISYVHHKFIVYKLNGIARRKSSNSQIPWKEKYVWISWGWRLHIPTCENGSHHLQNTCRYKLWDWIVRIGFERK